MTIPIHRRAIPSAILGRQWIFASALVLFSAAIARAQPDERLPIDLSPAVRWHTLAPQIRSTCIGLDGRRWLQLADDNSNSTGEELREALAREFRLPMPQIRASLALLEPDGRAWFYVKPNLLWGFDGEKWIERKATRGSRFTGYCPTRGQLLDNHANRLVDGRAWFRDEQGIHIFDGSDWSYTVLCPPINTEAHLPRYAVSPSGEYAVALTPQIAGRNTNLNNPDLWYWERSDPVWKKLAVVWGDAKSIFSSFCMTDEGKLWCTQGNTLRILNVAVSRGVLRQFPELIGQLENPDAQIRKRAEQTLDEAAEFLLSRLQAARTSVDSPEARSSLAAIIERVTQPAGSAARSISRPTAIGSFRISAVGEVYQEESGRILLFASTKSQDNLQALGGLILVGPAGDAKQLPIGPLTHIPTVSYLMSAGQSRGPIFSTSGDVLWISGTSSFGNPARRLNLRTGEIIPQDSDANFQFLEAVDSEDRAVLTISEAGIDAAAHVGIFAPQIPDPRPALESSTYQASPRAIVAPDGKVWAQRSEGLSRFDGSAWEVIFPISRGYVYPFLAGREGVMLGTATKPGEYALFQDKRLLGIALLRRLIASYPEIFRTGFPPSYTPVQRYYRSWIATDTQRNIWLLEDYQHLAAFTGEKWIDAPKGSDVPETMRSGLGPRVVVAVGGGSKVYFSGGLAEIKEEKMEFSPAPRCTEGIQMSFGLRDREGALWIPSYAKEITPSPFPVGSPQYLANPPKREHRSIRILDSGAPDEPPLDAWPFLIDSVGNVWLAAMENGRPRSHFWVWRQGQIVQELRIPGAQDMRAICSDKPGSVFVGTSLGLHHLVAEESAPAGKPFRLERTYALPRVLPADFSCTHSDLAGLVVTGSNALTLIALPKP